MEKKFTKRMALETLLTLSNVQADERLVAYCENELRLLNNKNKTASGDKKLTDKQIQNNSFKEAILDYLTEAAPAVKSISEIWQNVPALSNCEEMTGQRISALLTQLIKAGEVVRVEEKRKAYFKAA